MRQASPKKLESAKKGPGAEPANITDQSITSTFSKHSIIPLNLFGLIWPFLVSSVKFSSLISCLNFHFCILVAAVEGHVMTSARRSTRRFLQFEEKQFFAKPRHFYFEKLCLQSLLHKRGAVIHTLIFKLVETIQRQL